MFAVAVALLAGCSPRADQAPEPLEVTTHDGTTEGWLLTSVVPEEGQAVTGIIDRDGVWIWWMTSEPGLYAMSARVGNDGRSVLFGEFEPTNRGVDRGRVVRAFPDGGDPVTTRLVRGHHDFVEHADDHTLAFLSLHTIDVGLDYPLAYDRIDVVAEGADEDTPVSTLFDTFHDAPVDPSALCKHIERSRLKFDEEVHEWTHANSLVYLPEEDAYYLNAKWTDWVVKVDRATGERVWVMNGPGGDFTLPGGEPAWESSEASALWSHSHMSQAVAGGLMMFDNGLHHVNGVSALIRVEIDETMRTAQRVWEYPHPEGRTTQSMGDARLLPTGDVLGAWADLGGVSQVAEDGSVRWAARAPEGSLVGRTTWLPTLGSLVQGPQ